jgi:DNA-binding NtrC family response regulator
MQRIYKIGDRISKSNVPVPVLIVGETGVGKESLARDIQENSSRHSHPFMKVNCDLFPRSLLQNKFLGSGDFELSDGGTLFLVNILKSPLGVQRWLVTLLDKYNESLKNENIQVIATTTEDISVESGFSEELYYIFKGMTFRIPPLRERTEDIVTLVVAFISEYGNGTGITSKALTHLEQAAWPGNIRQLKGTVQTAVALATTDKLEPKDFPGIYPELAEVLISIWHTLPSETQDAIWETLSLETQHTIMHELSKQTAGFWRSLPVSNIPTKIENGESLNIENMNQNQILRAVAQKRIQQYTSLREAAESLSIDIRTLQRYAQWKESDE